MKLRMILTTLILLTLSFQVAHTKDTVPESPETIEHPILVSELTDAKPPQPQVAEEEIIPHEEPAPEETEEPIGEVRSVPDLTEEEVPPEETVSA